MSTFKNYSAYYDLIYHNKNYRQEAKYMHQLIKKNHPNAKTILNLGCGTGKHDVEFIKLGYDVIGIDLSYEMIEIANSNVLPKQKLKFLRGDIRTIRLKKKFDVVVSLFHVMSYQTSNEDFLSSLETAKLHLNKNGLLIFDCWYGPNVLTDIPVKKNKQVENSELIILRKAIPKMHYNRNIVDVHYDITVKDKASLKTKVIKEKHSVRYFFQPELELFYKITKLFPIAFYKWLTWEKPDENSWSLLQILRNS